MLEVEYFDKAQSGAIPNVEVMVTKQDRQRDATVGILTADCFDEWLEDIGVPLESFCEEMMGTWWFNYIQALNYAGIKSVLFCTSSKVDCPTKLLHKPTGATICLLPSSKGYRFINGLRNSLLSASVRGKIAAYSKRKIIGLLGLASSYLSTPLMLLRRELRGEGCRCMLVEQYEDPRFDASVLLGRMIDLPVFGTFTAVTPAQPWWMCPFRRIAIKVCAGLCICAGLEANRVMERYGYPISKLARIQYFVDFSIWYPCERTEIRTLLGITGSAKVVAYHGAIDLWGKGLNILVDAWQRICTDNPTEDLRLILIGKGSDDQKLSELLTAKQLRGVHWLNQWVHDRNVLRSYLTAADAYVFPSRNDPFGIAVLEAMACGLPIVAAAAPGILDIFEDGEKSGGIVVPTENAAELAGAIIRVLHNAGLAHDLGKRARERVEKAFSMDAVSNQLRHFLIGIG